VGWFWHETKRKAEKRQQHLSGDSSFKEKRRKHQRKGRALSEVKKHW